MSSVPSNVIENLFVLYNSGRYEELLKSSEVLLQTHAQDPQIWTLRGACFRSLGNLERAIDAFERSVCLSSHNAEALNNLGLALTENGRLSDAIKQLKQATIIAPKMQEAHFNLARCYQKLENYDQAIPSYCKAIELKPDYAEAFLNLGNIFSQIGKLEDSIRSYQSALAIRPSFLLARLNLSATLNKLGKTDEAIFEGLEMTKSNPQNAFVYNNLSTFFTDKGNLEAAVSSITKARKLNPTNPMIKKNLIKLLTKYQPKKNHDDELMIVNSKLNLLGERASRSLGHESSIQNFYSEMNSITNDIASNIGWSETQIHRTNSVNLGCERHMQIFNRYNSIPSACFKCFKIQVEVTNVINLIKLALIFDNLPIENTRKCMVETRASVGGNFKGLIYCDDLTEVIRIKPIVEDFLITAGIEQYSVVEKRGCSEYALAYPEYGKIVSGQTQKFEFPKDKWHQHELDFDAKQEYHVRQKDNPHLRGLTLSDALTILNWVAYANGIGDRTLDHPNISCPSARTVYEMASETKSPHP